MNFVGAKTKGTGNYEDWANLALVDDGGSACDIKTHNDMTDNELPALQVLIEYE
jgi:hypothetical protein